jgi:Domain of unknown function (DUF309)
VSRPLPTNADAMHDALVRGSTLFDAGAFFEAHEAWEEQWRVEIDETRRRFLQGLIQVAAAYHKLFVAHSVDAASRLLMKGLTKLDACPALVSTAGIEVFVEAVHVNARDLATGHVDRAAVPKLGARTARSECIAIEVAAVAIILRPKAEGPHAETPLARRRRPVRDR